MSVDLNEARGRRVSYPVEFNVLGPVTVTAGAESLNIGGPKQRAVLAMLIANVGKPVSADLIAQAVYGEDSPSRGRRRVQTYVSTLRSIVGDVIAKSGTGWSLQVARESVDSLRFEDIYRSAADSTPEIATDLLREALAVWRGHPYSDIEAHGALDAEIHRLTELRVAAQLARIEADLSTGRHADLIGEIEGLLAEHPYREQLRAQHMLALYRAGRQKEALRSYEHMRTLLVSELGVDPTPELQNLEQRILEQDETLHPAPRSSIKKRAVLVVDPGDPLELARLPAVEREHLLALSVDVLRKVAGSGEQYPGGTATYVVFDSPDEAAAATGSLLQRLDGAQLRMAVDYGDIEVSERGVSGPPVSRSAVLVSVAHAGQVVLSPDAQREILSAGGGEGLRFESLGSHDLPGIEGTIPIYQLLVGDPPRTFPPLRTDRIPPPLPDAGHRSVTGYELREPLGPGSIGTLYRAYQPSVGREVMVEVIGRADSSSADFIRNFEADAQRLALLDHPNINPLLDYWRDPEGAYLVYRHHRGGFLESGSDATSQMLAQIGSALAYAHSYGVVHGSLRPDLVVIDESGNAYVMGFPVGGVRAQSSPEYPAYIASETLAGQPPTPATDVYALGVLAQEIESGAPVGVELPVPLSEPIGNAIHDEPARRYESIDHFLHDLAPSAEEPAASRFTDTRNPYKGLAAFHESDAGDFFGRERLTRDLVSALAESRFLAVLGPSGVGKSSVVRAGLIPAVRRGEVEGSDSWLITDMLPGSHPFLELQRALERVAIEVPSDVRERFADRDPNALAGLSRVLPAGTELLVIVDQFEELFTMADEPVAAAFLDLLQAATELNQARFVVTMRADFLDRPLLYSGFGELLRRSAVMVRAPDPEELAEAISRPAAGVGVNVDSGLVERMVAEVSDQPGALPLLQHTLAELFDARSSDLIGLETFDEIGGISGSLTKRAESLYSALDDNQRRAIKQVFLRLVTVVDDGTPTRRRVKVTELDDLNPEVPAMTFVRNRLLVLDSDPDTRTPTVEVAHEALLVHWPRLAAWIDATRDDLAMSRRLGEAIADWEANSQDEAYLLAGGRLAQHQAWTTVTSLHLTEVEKGYLTRSVQAEEKARAKRRRRRQGIMAGFAAAALVAVVFGGVALMSARTAELKSEEAEANLVTATDSERRALEKEKEAIEAEELAVSAAAAAESSADLAKARELAASAISVVEDDPELATLLAIQSVDEAPQGMGLFSEGLINLRAAVATNRLIGRVKSDYGFTDVGFLPDGSAVLATSQGDLSLSRFDVMDGALRPEPKWVYQNEEMSDWLAFVDVHPDGGYALVTVVDGEIVGNDPDLSVGRVIKVDVESGQALQTVDFEPCEQVSWLTKPPYFSSDGSLFGLVLETTDCHSNPGEHSFVFFNTGDWSEAYRFGNAYVSMTDEMSQVLIDHWEGEPAELRTFPDLELVDVFEIESGRDHRPSSIEATYRQISPDGEVIVVRYAGGSEDLRPGFWSVDENHLIDKGDEFDGWFEGYASAAFSPDGLALIPSSESDVVYDPVSGGVELRLPTPRTVSAGISPDGSTAVTAHDDGLMLWRLDASLSGQPLSNDEADLLWVNPGEITHGPHVAFWSYDNGDWPFPATIAVVDPETGEVTDWRRGESVFGQFPDGRLAYVASEGHFTGDDMRPIDGFIGPLKVWDPSSGTEEVIQDCRAPIWESGVWTDAEPPRWIDFGGYICPDGDTFFGVEVVVSNSGNQLASLTFDPRNVSIGEEGLNTAALIRVWDAQGFKPITTFGFDFEVGTVGDIGGLHYFGDGWVVINDGTEGEGAVYRVIDTSMGEEIARLVGPSAWNAGSHEISSDYTSLFLGMQSGAIVEYDTSTWNVVRSWEASNTPLRGMSVSPDGGRIAVGNEEGAIAVWDLKPDEPSLVDRVAIGTFPNELVWIDDWQLGSVIGGRFGEADWIRVELDPDVVVRQAREALTRSFSSAECNTYNIEPCPTLEEMKAG